LTDHTKCNENELFKLVRIYNDRLSPKFIALYDLRYRLILLFHGTFCEQNNTATSKRH